MGYKLTWVYIRPNGTEQKIRPAEWQPWADTIAYYPFKWDVENKVDWALATLWSGSSIWSDYATLSQSIITCPLASTFDASSVFTFSIWANYYQTSWNPRLVSDSSSNPFYLILKWTFYQDFPLWVIINWTPDENANYLGAFDGLNTWNNVIIAYPWSWTDVYVYVNWVKHTYPNWFASQGTSNNLILGYSNSPDYAYFYVSEMILETKQWSDQDALNYYNTTKSNYGL